VILITLITLIVGIVKFETEL